MCLRATIQTRSLIHISGLDKIISEIGSDSSQRIKEISDEANKKAEEISLAAEKKVYEMNAQSEERTAAEVASVLASAKSSAELKKKQTVLEGKIEAKMCIRDRI